MKRFFGTVLLPLSLLFLAVAPARSHFGVIIPCPFFSLVGDRTDGNSQC